MYLQRGFCASKGAFSEANPLICHGKMPKIFSGAFGAPSLGVLHLFAPLLKVAWNKKTPPSYPDGE